MRQLHPLLLRHLNSLGLKESHPPASTDDWDALLAKISRVYKEADQERYLLERSLLISSKEMQERWEQLQKQKASIVQSSKMATLGEMAGNIAHEINTPLATVLLLAETIVGEAEEKKETSIAEASKKIKSTAQRIARIIIALKTFSRRSGQDRLTLYSLRSIIDETLNICQEKFRNKQIDIKIDVDEGHCIYCRPVQISQVLMNFLSNSYDAIEDRERPWLKIESEIDEQLLLLKITDCGSGISEDIAHRLMEPFFTTKAFGKGTGLGLSISKGIIDSHGGSISIDKTHPNTRFILRFPLPKPTS